MLDYSKTAFTMQFGYIFCILLCIARGFSTIILPVAAIANILFLEANVSFVFLMEYPQLG